MIGWTVRRSVRQHKLKSGLYEIIDR